MRVNFERLKRSLQELGAIGRTPEGGVSRTAFSDADMRARCWLLDRMAAAGLEVRTDPAGNLLGRMGAHGRVVLVGSHIDTVPNGGMFDGAVGVLAGLECLQRIREEGVVFQRPFELVAFSDEEGALGGFFGSYAFTGALSPESIRTLKDSSGVSIVDAMARWGMDAFRAPAARRDPKEIHTYVELHVEQGPVLAQRGIPIGVVEGIVGIRRVGITIRGRADHAGPTLMGERRDALLGAVELIQHGNDLIAREGGEASRLTVGILQLKPSVANIVPGEAYLTWELREMSRDALNHLSEESGRLMRRMAAARGLEVTMETILDVDPIPLAPRVRKTIAAAAEAEGLRYCNLPAMAGHDAQILAQVVDVGMIFIPSQEGRSHSPLEFTTDADVERGANVLMSTLLRLAAS